jgi:type I restriction enzyme, S subunit
MDWEVKKLGEVCEELFAGGDVPKKNSSKFKTEKFHIPIYSNGAKNKGLYGYTNVSRVKKPSITISARGTIGYSEIRYGEYLPVVRLIVLIPNKNLIDICFMHYAIISLNFVNSGTSIPQLTVPMVKKYEIPIPPLPIQKKIVSILDKAFKKISKAKENVEKNLKNTKEVFESYLHNVFENKGEGWEEWRLGDICEKTKNIKWQDYSDEEFQYIDLSSVSRNTLLVTNTTMVNQKNAPSRAKKIILEDDIIFGTTRPTLKRVAKITNELDGQICSTGFTVLRPIKELVLSDLIYYYLQTRKFMNKMKILQKGASYPAVTDSEIKNQSLFLPTISKQLAIFKKLDTLSKKTRLLEKIYIQKLNDLEKLKQSILQKAFIGELT